MRKSAGSRAVSTNLGKLLIAIILISIFCLGSLNFLTKFNIVYPTIEASSEFNNYNAHNTNFGVNQTFPSEIIIDTYHQVKIGDIIKPVMISSYGNKVSGLSYDEEENSIILLLNPLTLKGNDMWIDIPRDILDSKLNGNDKNFTVTIDDKPAKFLEITNNSKVNSVSNNHLDNISKIQYSNNTDTRKLMIEYGADSKIIKISGTDTNNLPKEWISTIKDNPRLYLPIKINNTIKYLPVQLNGSLLNSSELVINSEINRTLFLSILPHSNYGNMWIDIPRDILDSKLNGNDKNFTVTIDDKPAKFLEITNNSKVNSVSNSHLDNISKIQYSNNTDTRKLMIEYGADSKIIKISGTDTNNLSNNSQGIDIERDKTAKDQYGQQDNFFPIILIIMAAVGIAIFYLLYRKNKNLLTRKTRSR